MRATKPTPVARYQPEPLYAHAVRGVATLVTDACKTIETLHGNFDQASCRTATATLQRFLLRNVPATVYDDVYKQWRSSAWNSLRVKTDKRICFSLFVNENMRKFKADIVPGSNVEMSTFWSIHISKLKNIMNLNLNYVCTDEVLEVVSLNCRRVMKIHIRAPASLKRDGNISDVGLSSLAKCKCLRVIDMDSRGTITSNDIAVTHAGIRHLVRSLPNLGFISYNDMGGVFDVDMEEVDTLPLLKLGQEGGTLRQVKNLIRFCPRLQNLTLWGETSTVEDQEEMLDLLAECDLNFNTLKMIGFDFNGGLKHLLRKKGSKLVKLILELKEYVQEEDNLTVSDIVYISNECPKLRTLRISANINLRYEGNPTFAEQEPIFTELRSLHVKSTCDYNLVRLFLGNAFKLEEFCFDGRYSGSKDTFEKALRCLFTHNPLLKLLKGPLHASYNRLGYLLFKL